MSNQLVPVPQVGTDGVLRFELSDYDMLRLSPDELVELGDALHRAAMQQVERGVELISASHYDPIRRVHCIAFARK